MKRIARSSFIVAVLLLPGCASLPSSAARAKTSGTLTVYTAQAWSTVGDGPMSYVHTEYDVTTPENGFVTRERNVDEQTGRSPIAVKLPAGNYVVIAHATGRGKVEVPVKIEAGRLTELHLDESQRQLACAPAR